MTIRAKNNYVPEAVSNLCVFTMAVAWGFIPTTSCTSGIVNFVSFRKPLAFSMAGMAIAAKLSLAVLMIAFVPNEVFAVRGSAFISFHTPLLIKGEHYTQA